MSDPIPDTTATPEQRPQASAVMIVTCNHRYAKTLVDEIEDQLAIFQIDGAVLCYGTTSKERQGFIAVEIESGSQIHPALKHWLTKDEDISDYVVYDTLSQEAKDEAKDRIRAIRWTIEMLDAQEGRTRKEPKQ